MAAVSINRNPCLKKDVIERALIRSIDLAAAAIPVDTAQYIAMVRTSMSRSIRVVEYLKPLFCLGSSLSLIHI